MTYITQGAPPAPDPIPVVSLPDDAPETFSISQAARFNKPKDKPSEAAPTEAAPPAEQSEAAPAAEDAAPADTQAPGETESADPAETLPPVDAPRSWTTEDKELFK